MTKPKFEKFEMKYGYLLPEEFKGFMNKFGGDSQFGSCRFEYPENIINNILRIPGRMDFRLIPFGDIGNGDYYCFFRYGKHYDEYYIGLWLHETENFVILTSNFKAFLYKCLLDDYLSMAEPQDEFDDFSQESLERAKILSDEFGFDLEKVKNIKDEFDYHRLMAEYDNRSIQSLCYLGKHYLKGGNERGIKYLEQAINYCPFYTAPHYILGKVEYKNGSDGSFFMAQGLKTSIMTTGYSYWEEDYLEIPEDVHREMALYAERLLKDSRDSLKRRIYLGEDPYDFNLRLDMAQEYQRDGRIDMAIMEYSNSIYCAKDTDQKLSALEKMYRSAKDNCIYYLTRILEQDIKNILRTVR